MVDVTCRIYISLCNQILASGKPITIVIVKHNFYDSARAIQHNGLYHVVGIQNSQQTGHKTQIRIGNYIVEDR